MAHLLFIDESGSDFSQSPVAVLGGLAIEDRKVWDFILEVKRLEQEHFGMEYRHGSEEIKGKKFLSRKVFQKAAKRAPFEKSERRGLAKACLENGASAGAEISALAQAKLEFVTDVFSLCLDFRCRVFAAMVEHGRIPTGQDFLRRDYIYLLERFYYFLDDSREDSIGIVVFDELEKKQSSVLADQMRRYYQSTAKGQHRARLLLPEPFFVHSDLTTGIQVADLICYAMGMGFRLPTMRTEARAELAPYIEQIKRMRYFSQRDVVEGQPLQRVWSVKHVAEI